MEHGWSMVLAGCELYSISVVIHAVELVEIDPCAFDHWSVMMSSAIVTTAQNLNFAHATCTCATTKISAEKLRTS